RCQPHGGGDAVHRLVDHADVLEDERVAQRLVAPADPAEPGGEQDDKLRRIGPWHGLRPAGRVLAGVDQPAAPAGLPADPPEPVAEPVVAVQARLQARRVPDGEVELELAERAARRIRPGHGLDVAYGQRVPHSGGPVQELADLLGGYRPGVVMLAD